MAVSGDRYNLLTEPIVMGIKYPMIRALLEDHDVLVDDSHTTERSICKLLEIQNDAEFYFVPTNPTVCQIRAEETGQADLCPIIQRMYNNLSQLTGYIDMSFISHSLDVVIRNLRKKVAEAMKFEDRRV